MQLLAASTGLEKMIVTGDNGKVTQKLIFARVSLNSLQCG